MLYINRIQAIHKFIFNPVSILSLRSLQSAVYKQIQAIHNFIYNPVSMWDSIMQVKQR